MPFSRGVLLDEVVDERRDVLLALAQRRELDRDDVQPVEEVLAEASLLDGAPQVDVGGRHDPDVHLDGLDAAEPHELALLHHAQELGLGLEGDVADLVEEQRALVRQLEEALLGVDRPGEGALHVAEEVRLEQVVGQAARVDHDEGLVGPRAVGVDRLGHQLLAGAALAHHQDRGARRRRLGDQAEDLLHPLALAHDLGEARLVPERGAQLAVLVLQAALVEPVAQDVEDLLVLEGLGDVVEGALLHRRDGGLHRGVGRDHQHDQVRVDLLQLLEDLEAAHLRQHHVHDGGVEAVPARQGQPLGRRSRPA